MAQIDLNLFRVFDAVYRERNLTRAASVLSVTQPAVSNALSRLRAAMGDPLFIRTSDGMSPTPFAESISDRVAEALTLMAGTVRRDGFDPARSTRVFRLSMPDLFDQLSLLPLLNRVGSRAPGIGFRSFRLPRSEIADALTRGTLDIAVEVALPDTTNLVRRALPGEAYVCGVRPGHPAVAEGLSMERYLALGHVHVSARKRGSGAVDTALRTVGATRRIRVRLQNHLSVRDLVMTSDFAVSLPRSWALALGLTVLPLPFDVPEISTFLYRHVLSDGDPAILWLFAELGEVA